MSASATVRHAAATLGKSLRARSIHASAKTLKADAHAVNHAEDPNAYIHAVHMYDLPAMKNRKLKFGIAIFSLVFIGTAIPVVAVFKAQGKLLG